MSSGSFDELRLIEVYSAAHDVEAGAVRAVLDAAGIRAQIVGSQLGNAGGGVPLGYRTEPKIWVREEDAALAREIIRGYQEEASDPARGAELESESFDFGGRDEDEAIK